VVLVLQGGGALGAYQVAQCRFSLHPPSEESGVDFPSDARESPMPPWLLGTAHAAFRSLECVAGARAP
jgi:hypothetical protein